MSETPTNRTPEVVTQPDGTCSVDTGVGRTVFAAPAPPAPEMLSAVRLARIAEIPADLRTAYVALVCASNHFDLNRQIAFASLSAQRAINQLLAHYAAAVARAAEAEAQVAMLKTELAEQERELSYERQMRQQTEEAMIKLATQR